LKLFSPPDFKDGEFCIVEDEGVFVDLIRNPEGFTGYRDERIWPAIYDANCFDSKYSRVAPEGENWGNCVEKDQFYRIISGLHTSISCQIANNYFENSKKEWIKNKKLFETRVGDYKDRIENLGILYLILAKAIKFSFKKILAHDFIVETDKERDILKVHR
jgi:ERO1-like protein beta